ncbi:hypothetical protein DAPPUDRAFT_300541 [Daphnia pulex]|uniref:Uncharacterized protein n=1 Tax=Daphnia pulex TaxID=6669 RepID=E9HDE5_DAPPU|nr:hypothetical protein DAPPUDRAFT_300541 [Daphnia pulex]|eukprot:EFX70239.1 hypothetical protein DAPPUDRAFT_300541 [Daphnia pulex]
MEQNDGLREACSKLREIITKNQIRLDAIQKVIDKSKKPSSTISNLQIQQAGPVAAFETRKQGLSSMQEGLKVSDCQPNFPDNKMILIKLARLWQSRSKTEIQELIIEEKLKQASLRVQRERAVNCLNENKQLLEVHLKEKRSLENKEEELEEERVSELEEKLENAKRQYGEMKINLKNTVGEYFPEPEIPGFTGIYSLFNELTKRLINGERDAYAEVKNTWPYYLETLEANGIIECHPTDRSKIRIIDFSDGRLGKTD